MSWVQIDAKSCAAVRCVTDGAGFVILVTRSDGSMCAISTDTRARLAELCAMLGHAGADVRDLGPLLRLVH